MRFYGDILGERARLTPGREALVYLPTGERFSYGALDARTRGRAQHCRTLGIGKGDRVAILAANCTEYVEVFFAAARTGAILVPLNTRLSAHELEYIVRDAGARLLFFDPQHAEAAAAVCASTGARQVGLEESPECDTSFQPADCGPEDPCCLLYTSGTTGKPKGVVIPHRQVIWNAYNTAASWQLRDTDVVPIFTPMCHAGGLTVFLTALCVMGGRVVLHRKFDAAEVWRAIATERCTLVFGVPTTFKLMMEVPEFESSDIGSVRWMISGGAPLPIGVLDAYRRRGITLRQGYGLTEVGVNCFSMTDEEARRKLGSIGRPMMFTQARLVDDVGNDVARAETGQLLLRGAHVSSGYWHNPDATAASLDADGWFHTGDVARQDEDGFFYIAGRLTDMFISGGINVYPAEIEAELLLCPGVRDAAVLSKPDETWGEIGVAFIIAEPDTVLTPETLTARLRTRLAKFKIPREFRFVSTLPRTEYGKVAKTSLREML